MQNLAQVRARNVLKFTKEVGELSGPDGGEVIRKIPPLVMNNGLLATIAYSYAEKKDAKNKDAKKRDAWKLVFDAIALHLASSQIGIVAETVKDRQSLMDYLVKAETTSETLKRATSETMAWLDYARRFVKKA